MAAMTRWLWIVGLIFALCFYGALTVVFVVALVRHHHLNATAWIMLGLNSYVVWIAFRYLRHKITRNPEPFQLN
jgi:hypothetical protein